MKKLISTLLLIIVLFNFILNSGKVYATDFSGEASITEETMPASEQEAIVNGGGVTNYMTGNKTSLSWNVLGDIFGGTLAGIIAVLINTFPIIVESVMSAVVSDGHLFTIERTVFNQFKLFNINYFDFNNTTSMTKPIRETVAKFYIILRLIAMILSLIILIYIGIRMALSTVAGDKAKYKKMLIGWIESIILLFIMQYIMSLIFNLGEMFTEILSNMRNTLIAEGGKSFEELALNKIYSAMFLTNGWQYVFYSVVFWFLIYIQTKFFVMYVRRTVVVGFLVLIAPLVTITYPIDKVGDGKAQAFSAWFFEFMINVFIQPIQALIYLIFIYTAGAIAEYSLFVALLFLLSLTKVDKIILHLFNLRNMVSLRPVDEERKKKV